MNYDSEGQRAAGATVRERGGIVHAEQSDNEVEASYQYRALVRYTKGSIYLMTTDMQSWSAWHQQAPRKSVAIGAVVQKDTALLFVRHTYGILRGQWSFPTGFAEPLESPEITALREVQEEGGITAAVDGLLTLCTVNWESDIQLYLVWLCQHIKGEPTPDGVEVDRAVYLSAADLEVFHEPIVPFSRWLATRVFQQQYQVLQPVDMTTIGPYLGIAFA